MITDDMLNKSAIIAHEALLSTLPAPNELEHEFSRRFERKMRKLIRHTKYPVVYNVLKTAACFILVSILAAAMFLSANVKAREAFFKWVKEKYEYFIEYYFDGMVSDEVIEDNAMAEYRLGWVPEGYVESEVYYAYPNTTVLYKNDDNIYIILNYRKNPTISNLFFFDKNLYTHFSEIVNKINTDIYISTTPTETNTIIWTNTDKNLLFYITAYVDKTNLIKMAEHIISTN